jgi:hypothetical protein
MIRPRVLPLGEEEGLEYGLDLKTGRVIGGLPHRELDPVDGPLPQPARVPATEPDTSDASKAAPEALHDIDLDAILAELAEDRSRENQLMPVVIGVLKEVGIRLQAQAAGSARRPAALGTRHAHGLD